MTLKTNTYTNTGQKPLIILESNQSGVNYFTVKAGSLDIYSIEIQLIKDAQRVVLPQYKNVSADTVGRIPYKTYAIGLNIINNDSGSIILDISSI